MAREWSQLDVERKAGVRADHLCRIEHGQQPRLDICQRLADGYGITLAHLFEGVKVGEEAQPKKKSHAKSLRRS